MILSLKPQGPIPLYHGDLELELNLVPGTPLALVGPNGSGKSSIFQFFKFHQGTLFKGLRPGFLDQGPLAPLGALSGADLFDMLSRKFPEACRFPHVREYPLVEEFQWRNKLDLPIKSLSGGENQVLKILALFYLHIDIYFLDEPTGHLDPAKRRILTRIIRENLKNQYMVIVDHNHNFLFELCPYFVPLENKGVKWQACTLYKKEEFQGDL